MESLVVLLLLVLLPLLVVGAALRTRETQAKAGRLDRLEERVASLEAERTELVRHIDVLHQLVAEVEHGSYAPFEALFAGRSGEPPLYLSLLHLHDAGPALSAIAERCERPERIGEGLQAMLEQPDWRPHLVAATAMWFVPDASPHVPALWACIEEQSWVGPQLVATAARVDDDFQSHARAWLDAAASTGGWDPKTAAAMLAFVEDDRAAIRGALAVGLASDVDDGGSIARGWSASMEAALSGQ